MEGGATIYFGKHRKTVLFAALLLTLEPFVLSGSALCESAYGKTAFNNSMYTSSYKFVKGKEEAVVRVGDRQIAACILQEDKVLTIEGTEEIALKELRDSDFLTVDFSITDTVPESRNDTDILSEYQTVLFLSGDPVYWRLDTKGKVFGVGNIELTQPEELRELLPTSIKGIKAVFRILQERDNTRQVQMSLIGDAKGEDSLIGFTDEINRSSLPKELRELTALDRTGGDRSALELKANYVAEIPLIRSGETADKDTPFVKVKLTLITHIEIYND